jgi:hypothetical protein
MGCLKKGAIILGIVVGALTVFLGICIALGAIGSNLGHSQGYELGKVEGYDEGQSQGYDIGHDEGHNKGYQEGYDKGYEESYDKGYKEGYDAGYEEVFQTGEAFRNPTYQEMKDFLRRDTTDRNVYVGRYDCENFAADVCNNAEAEGIRAATVVLRYENGGHEIVAFETTDKGLIFIEPQEDREVKVEVGMRYLASFGGYIIKRIIIFW